MQTTQHGDTAVAVNGEGLQGDTYIDEAGENRMKNVQHKNDGKFFESPRSTMTTCLYCDVNHTCLNNLKRHVFPNTE